MDASISRPSRKSISKVIIVSEIFFPETTSTGYYLTAIARKLAELRNVYVLCSRPSGTANVACREIDHGVRIERIGRMNAAGVALPRRIIGAMGRGFGMLLWLVWHAGSKDLILVGTNPPLLPPLVAVAGWMRRARVVLLVHDVYPQAAIVAGLLRRGSFWERVGSAVQLQVYRRARLIICLGRDMRDLITKDAPNEQWKLAIVPHWAEIDTIRVMDKRASCFGREMDAAGKFVVLCAGNFGRTHDGDLLLRAASLGDRFPDLLLLIAAAGSQASRLASEASRRGLSNVAVRPLPADRNCQSDTLAASDVVIIAFKSGMTGVSVPSRMYNVMAAGRPLIGVTEEGSELALVIREEEIGWVTPPGDAVALMCAIVEARSEPDRLRLMGQKARVVAETKYSPAAILARYEGLIGATEGRISSL